ncbi:MAG: phosphoglycerate dehydrogenase [Firmicutes bacterium]|nr:phosphoglycerate dehydrogenase [Bacillota bacterium]
MKILVSDPLSPQGLKLLRQHAQADLQSSLTAAELQQIIGDYDALIVRSSTRVTADLIEAGRRLKVIGRAGVGVDNIDVAKATEKGIIVVNVPEANTVSAAELTLALLVSLARNIPGANYSVKQGAWARERFLGIELHQKTLGIIGLGHVGSEVGRRARALGMRVLACDPYISSDHVAKIGVELVELPLLLEQSDFISLHVPLMPATHHLIGAEEISRMKPEAMLINCARGGVVDETALFQALAGERIAGAALDVFEEEPPLGSPLLQLDNVIATPHLGALTREAQTYVALQVAEQVLKALSGEPVTSAVNVPALMPETAAALEPYLPLMRLLGSFYMQLYGGSIDEIEVVYSGEIASLPLAPLTSSCLAGLLQGVVDIPVTPVNAPLIAQQRGIRVREISTAEEKSYSSLVQISIREGAGMHRLAGTLLSHDDIRITQIGDYRIEVVPARCMLITTHHDRPGVVGKVGTLLGGENVNIASMQLGRQSVGGEAMMVLQVDDPISQEVMDKLRKLDVIASARFVELANWKNNHA